MAYNALVLPVVGNVVQLWSRISSLNELVLLRSIIAIKVPEKRERDQKCSIMIQYVLL